jgi:hypothetical protein
MNLSLSPTLAKKRNSALISSKNLTCLKAFLKSKINKIKQTMPITLEEQINRPNPSCLSIQIIKANQKIHLMT